MKRVETTTTLTCDRCLTVVSRLTTVYEESPFTRYDSYCSHKVMRELCGECWRKLEEFLGFPDNGK